ncbi:MAG TPA: aspartyl protease family protein [Afifellaceae bacterium]|nr:aspartyl protease family protein [Afifellaceae bacterium]
MTLHGASRSLDLLALLDSGADHCLFHTEVAEVLGIDLSACPQGTIEGIDGEPHASFVAEVDLSAQHLPSVRVPVMFWDKQPVSLLGQTGFFDLHRIKFERDHDVFEITPIEKR